MQQANGIEKNHTAIVCVNRLNMKSQAIGNRIEMENKRRKMRLNEFEFKTNQTIALEFKSIL